MTTCELAEPPTVKLSWSDSSDPGLDFGRGLKAVVGEQVRVLQGTNLTLDCTVTGRLKNSSFYIITLSLYKTFNP